MKKFLPKKYMMFFFFSVWLYATKLFYVLGIWPNCFAVSALVSTWQSVFFFSWPNLQSKNVQIGSTGYFKLTIGGNVALQEIGSLPRVYPTSHLKLAGISTSFLVKLNR